MSDILNCPHCNGIAKTDNGKYWWVECKQCGAAGPCTKTETEAIAAWNRRAPASDATPTSPPAPDAPSDPLEADGPTGSTVDAPLGEQSSASLAGPFRHRFDQLAVFENGRTPIFLLESEYNRAQLCWTAHDELLAVATEMLELSDNWPGIAYTPLLEARARTAIAKATERAA